MTRAASALVRDIPDGHAAAAAALQHAGSRLDGRPDAAILFASPHYRGDADAILGVFRQAGCRSVVGGCASGILTDEGECESGPGLAVLLLRDVEARHFHAPTAEHLREAIPAGDVSLILPDPSKMDLSALLKDFDAAGEFRPLLGGALSGGTESTGHYQFTGQGIESGGTCGMTLSGASFTVGITQGCRPIGKPLVITRCQGHIVLSLAGRPPLEVLKETLQNHARAEGGPGGPVMAGIAVDSTRSPLGRGDFIVRNLIAVQAEDGAVLAVGTPVRVGQTLVFQLMDRTSAEIDMKEMVGDLRTTLAGTPPACGLYFNCRGRGRHLFGQTDHDVTAIRAGLGDFPFVGFFGNAEFAPIGRQNWMHNYTGIHMLLK